MANIKVLPEHLINQIAAGEVVERPASVVKELVENSLDARPTRVTIEVHGGGDTLIRVTDDGSGMDVEDAKLTFERHATSKISRAEDLTNIHTLGFRGEAIASIASVSYMTLQTKKRGEMEGTFILSEGGKLVKVKAMGCPEGTQIEVKQLFYNTPARKKYLKNDSTEYGKILEMVTGIALANPAVAFKLVRDDKIVFDLAATNELQIRIRELLGREVADNLIPVFFGHSQMQLEGFIGKPLLARSNRKGQYLFVNGREVSSHVLSYAVKQAYYSLIPKEKHPIFVLFLNLDPELVDVNVHPRKLEVRFSDEKAVFSAFIQASKKALEKHVLAPSFEEMPERQHQTLLEDRPATPIAMNVTVTTLPTDEKPPTPIEERNPQNDLFVSEHESTAIERGTVEELVPLAQMDNSYILCQQGNSLVVMDQHAAHERIRYTELLEQYDKKEKSTQPLLVPVQCDFSPAEIHVLESNAQLFADMGFEVEPFGGNTYSIFGVPSLLVQEDPLAVIRGIIDDLNNQSVKGDLQQRKERALTFAACRSAVKFGDPLSMEEMIALCKRLMQLKLPYTCPHGRPTMVTMTFDELEKKFGRDYKGL